MSRERRALRLTVAERRSAVVGFFSAHQGGGLGLGAAVDDFLDWEVRSGRVVDGSGSAWWKTMNGLLVLDLADASQGAASPHPPPSPPHPPPSPPHPPPSPPHALPAAAWANYAMLPPGLQQDAFWHAHQASIENAVAMSSGLLSQESPAEQEFIAIVLGVLESVSRRARATDNGSLRRAVDRFYPSYYPITCEDVENMRRQWILN